MGTEVEMKDEQMINNEKENDIEMIRKKLNEWNTCPYQFQYFSIAESGNWRHRAISDSSADEMINIFNESCKDNERFDFSIEPMIVGEVKHWSYSELEGIANFKPGKEIQKTLSGRLFHGTIVEGSKKRPAIVKTWDFLLPMENWHAQRLSQFCDEVELLTDERANTHRNLVKLYSFCLERRLAVVYDEKFTRVLSNVLLADCFGWDERMKVATQLADLLAWLHDKGIAVGSITAACIMVDDEVNIKVFDFGYVSNHVNEDSIIPLQAIVGWDAPEAVLGKRRMKSDVYAFGLLLLELITKKDFDLLRGPVYVKHTAAEEAKRGEKYLVHECFREVDYLTAFNVTLLVFLCMDFDPDKRPAMKDVLDAL